MPATVRLYRFDDAGAPVLNGVAGAMIALLDACLVNGYGAKPGAGWTKPFVGTNLAAFRSGAGGAQAYLMVTDTAAQEARVTAYKDMTAISVGTDPFPTNVQVAGGSYMHKSSAASALARPWILLACERAFYLFASVSLTALGTVVDAGDHQTFFGDVQSFKTGDAFGAMLIAQGGAIGSPSSALAASQQYGSSSFSALGGHFMPRRYIQTGTAISISKSVIGPLFTTMGSSNGTTYPDPVTGGMRLARVVITEDNLPGYVERGLMPGLWAPLHNAPAGLYDTFGGTGDLAGKTFMLLPGKSQSNVGRVAMEIAGSWGL